MKMYAARIATVRNENSEGIIPSKNACFKIELNPFFISE